MKTIKDFELFRVGTHNGLEYTEAELQQMVDAFKLVGYQVPVKYGHAEYEGMPAMGWVTELRVEDGVLLATMEVQPWVYDDIKATLYDHVSAEIFFDVERDGVKYPCALKAVALLGAETPGCAGLKPLREAAFAMGEHSRVANFTVEKAKMSVDPKTGNESEVVQLRQQAEGFKAQLANAQSEIETLRADSRRREIDEAVNRCKLPGARKALSVLYALASTNGDVVKFKACGDEQMAEHSGKKMVDDIIGMLNKLAEKFADEVSEGGDPAAGKGDDDEEAGVTLDKLTHKHMAETKITDYAAAFRVVVKNNPELAKRYAHRTQ